MTAQAQIVADDAGEFFAPVSSDLVDGLIGEFHKKKREIESLADAMDDPTHASVLHHFIEGNLPDQRNTIPTSIEKLFSPDGAVAHLTAAYWDRALRMTDVMDYMPQKRRDEWHEQIKNPLGRKSTTWDHETKKQIEKWHVHPLPAFEEETVRSTLHGLLISRMQFLAERVDGIFRALSRTHVTNRPEGFSKRMILPGVISSFGTVDYRASGYINDLRCVIAKFMGRDEPRHGATNAVIGAASQFNGQWQGVDGNALRIRIYNGVGTAHIEVHPEMAWRLNAILAHLYPAAIPSESRTRPKRPRKIKDFELFDRPLPFAVLSILSSMKEASRRVENPGFNQPKYRPVANTRQFNFDIQRADKHALNEAVKIIQVIGGVRASNELGDHWAFGYDPSDVLDQIICTGCIPDQKSHQFYPTPESLAKRVIELASEDATPKMHWLEPSAGTGGLADHVPEDAFLECYEVSKLHCEVLKAKGYTQAGRRAITCLDFLQLANDYRGGGYNRVVMNPPFDQGRWLAHIEAAASVTAKNARIVAVLPEGAAKRLQLPGFALQWHGPYSNEFAGTSISVVIVVADKQ
ncbi:DUF4942 domain-containing protein [Halomonas sp. N3-2A]|uniref:DUF4942 domain-containing protein n=1 Tax=Halomonas sp. N3-2A TaxID=2014541 RepID=UPI000B5B34A7|nr:DUF4942 domain-containing protein [Halomonas sp. N3-2A]ASK18428.1 restriction endonuclease subunit M [Halomonas sp. N3-2A]